MSINNILDLKNRDKISPPLIRGGWEGFEYNPLNPPYQRDFEKGEKRNLIFSAMLLLAITFSIITVMRAATPDPGHSLTELDLGNIENTALSTWAGTSNLTTLGTITLGTWNGSVIDDTYVSSATTWNAKQDALGFTPEDSANKGIAGGYASLDGAGLIPTAQIPASVLGKVEYKEIWDANTNTPDLPSAIPNKGDYYVVSVAGSTSLGGITDWKIGDWAIYDGTTWGKVENTDSVTSVNGDIGAVNVTPTSLGLVIGTNVQAWDADLDSWSAIAPASVDKSYVGLGNVEDTALSAWAGTANLTTLGTITTGVWNGTVIDDTYVSSSATWNAKGLVLGSTYGTTFASGTNYVSFLGLSTSNATLINRQFIVPISGTLKNFYIRTITAEPASGSLTLTIMQNGVATALSIVIPAGSAIGTFSDTVNSISVSAGDLLSVRATKSGGGASASVASYSVFLE